MPKYDIVALKTHREIAKELGISPMTVFNDIQSAMEKLYAHMTKGDPDPPPFVVTRSSCKKRVKNR